ncbi:MAG: hypothetical protein ACLRSY_05110 [Acutalibacter sp.]
MKDAIQNAKENAMKTPGSPGATPGSSWPRPPRRGGLGRGVYGPASGRRQRGFSRPWPPAPAGGVHLLRPGDPGPDLGILQANHYKIEQIQPVDMFPTPSTSSAW